MKRVVEIFETPTFSLWQRRRRTHKKATLRFLEIRDRYGGRRHRVGRIIFGQTTRMLEWFYRWRRDIVADSPKNYVQKMIYLPPGIRAWRKHIPGGFATYTVHDPDMERLSSGERIDGITRRLFRHSSDGIGLRSRAYAMSWWVYRHTLKRTRRTRLRWLSIATGTGQPTFDAGTLYTRQPEYFLSDIADEMLVFADDLARQRDIDQSLVHTIQCDATNDRALTRLLQSTRPDVIDMMGLIEYLDNTTVVRLLRQVRNQSDALVCFTNMRPEHPQLQTHQRGLGWPGTQVRSIEQMLDLISSAGIPLQTVDVLLPSDKVYAVYCLS